MKGTFWKIVNLVLISSIVLSMAKMCHVLVYLHVTTLEDIFLPVNTQSVIACSKLSIETLEQGVNFAGLLMFLKQTCTTDFDRRVFNWNTFLNG